MRIGEHELRRSAPPANTDKSTPRICHVSESNCEEQSPAVLMIDAGGTSSKPMPYSSNLEKTALRADERLAKLLRSSLREHVE